MKKYIFTAIIALMAFGASAQQVRFYNNTNAGSGASDPWLVYFTPYQENNACTQKSWCYDPNQTSGYCFLGPGNSTYFLNNSSTTGFFNWNYFSSLYYPGLKCSYTLTTPPSSGSNIAPIAADAAMLDGTKFIKRVQYKVYSPISGVTLGTSFGMAGNCAGWPTTVTQAPIKAWTYTSGGVRYYQWDHL